jgi:archaellum component FlaF (FlaF/FlaG flagellin family)
MSPTDTKSYHNDKQYYQLDVKSSSPKFLFCLISVDKLYQECHVHNVFETCEEAIKSLYDLTYKESSKKLENIYVSEFGLENEKYIRGSRYYRIKCLTIMFDESVQNHYFLGQCTHEFCRCNLSLRHEQDFSHVIANPNENNDSLQCRISNYYKDVDKANQYRIKIISELNDIENNEFTEMIKKRYGNHSTGIIDFLSKYQHINAEHSDYVINTEIERRCKGKS